MVSSFALPHQLHVMLHISQCAFVERVFLLILLPITLWYEWERVRAIEGQAEAINSPLVIATDEPSLDLNQVI